MGKREDTTLLNMTRTPFCKAKKGWERVGRDVKGQGTKTLRKTGT